MNRYEQKTREICTISKQELPPHQIEQIVQVAVTMELDNMPLTEECYKENLE